MNLRWMTILAITWAIFAGSAIQAEEAQPGVAPRILTSDLTRIVELDQPVQLVNFVIVGDREIESILINGEAQTFQPAATVIITRRLQFSQGKSLVTVAATDDQGLKTERSFLVGYGEREIEEAPPEKTSGFDWRVDLLAALETDDNPTNDMSSALETFTGVVPDDRQTDSRLRLDATLSADYGRLNGVAGAHLIRYDRGENRFLNSQVLFGGVGYRGEPSSGRSWLLDFMTIDIDAGGYDYALVQTLSPGIEFRSRGIRGEHRSLRLGFDLIYKDFAIESRQDAMLGTIKSEYQELDEEQRHLFRNRFAYGTGSEGTAESEHTLVRFDFDWENRWTYGLLWDVGFGIQHRTFPHSTALRDHVKFIDTGEASVEIPLGETHISIPFRLETSIGWRFSDRLQMVYHFCYLLDLSNDVSYTRTINGFVLSSTF